MNLFLTGHVSEAMSLGPLRLGCAGMLRTRLATLSLCRHACYHAFMAQITIRADDDLIQRVKGAAAEVGRSMNDYVTSVLDAATDPNLAGTSAERIRERLRVAGLLATPTRLSGRRPSAAAVAAAGARAASGRPVSEFVSEGR